MEDEDEIYIAAIEGGGTTFVVSVARVIKSNANGKVNHNLQLGPTRLEILNTTTIPPKHSDTGEILHYTPTKILSETCAFLSKHLPSCGHYSAVGIATFGPAGVNSSSQNYGTILSGSPKREWRNIDLLSPIAKACGLDGNESMKSRISFDTDVNAPALAEFRHRCYLQKQQQSIVPTVSTKPLTSLSYITIGTGVGVGLILNSHPIHGLLHPEGGHVCVQPLANDSFTDGYSWGKEKSPYGGVGTVEGITSSVALTERYLQMEDAAADTATDDIAATTNNKKNIDHAQTREVLSTLPDTHEVWDHASNAIANLCVSILLLTSCEKIVLGGGIMKRTILYSMVRQRVWKLLNGYLDSVDELSHEQKLDDVIVESSWEEMGSGLVGAFALALDAFEKHTNDGKLGETDYQISSESSEAKGYRKAAEQQLFTSGVLAGIGLSFGCILLTSFFGRGVRQRH